jgi:peptidoglycan/LPS O-acetylase OafA/YrhL
MQSERSAKHPPIPALTGLRFFAALSILLGHSIDTLINVPGLRGYLGWIGIFGMPLFFVLSGFVIHYNYRGLFADRSWFQAAGNFGIARFARLYPLYGLLLLLFIATDNFFQQTNYTPALAWQILARNITLTQSWWYSVYNGLNIIWWLFGLSWSISTEMFFYLFYAVIGFRLVRARSGTTAISLAVAWAIGSFAFFAYAWHSLPALEDWGRSHFESYIPFGTNPNQSFCMWLFYFSPYGRLSEFILGCFVAQAVMVLRDHPVSSYERNLGVALTAFALLGFVVAAALFDGSIRAGDINWYALRLSDNVLCAPAVGLLLFCVARYETGVSRLLGGTLIVAFGDASYSIYLIHATVLRMFVSPPTGVGWLGLAESVMRLIFYVGTVIFISYCLYLFFEAPARSWCRQHLGALFSKLTQVRDRPKFGKTRGVVAEGAGLLQDDPAAAS